MSVMESKSTSKATFLRFLGSFSTSFQLMAQINLVAFWLAQISVQLRSHRMISTTSWQGVTIPGQSRESAKRRALQLELSKVEMPLKELLVEANQRNRSRQFLNRSNELKSSKCQD